MCFHCCRYVDGPKKHSKIIDSFKILRFSSPLSKMLCRYRYLDRFASIFKMKFLRLIKQTSKDCALFEKLDNDLLNDEYSFEIE